MVKLRFVNGIVGCCFVALVIWREFDKATNQRGDPHYEPIISDGLVLAGCIIFGFLFGVNLILFLENRCGRPLWKCFLWCCMGAEEDDGSDWEAEFRMPGVGGRNEEDDGSDWEAEFRMPGVGGRNEEDDGSDWEAEFRILFFSMTMLALLMTRHDTMHGICAPRHSTCA